MLPGLLFALSLAGSALSSPILEERAEVETFNNRVIYQAGPDYNAQGTLYGRSCTLDDGTILGTWENYSPEPPKVYFPIYASSDSGATWSERSRAQDTARGFGLRYQPFLYVLPNDFAEFKKGDILLSGSSIPSDLSSTNIELYVSRDKGFTWTFVSHVTSGGPANPGNGQTPVWEPAILLFNDELIIYYSDQRDPAHAQKLVHQSSKDGKSWGPIVNDVADPAYGIRPGMAILAQLPNDYWIYVYESGGAPVGGVPAPGYPYPIYYKIGKDPKNFGSVKEVQMMPNNGPAPTSGSPYVVATRSGKIILSSGPASDLYINHFNTDTNAVDPNAWVAIPSGERTSYTRSLNLHVGSTVDEYLLLLGAGDMFNGGTKNSVTVGVIDIRCW